MCSLVDFAIATGGPLSAVLPRSPMTNDPLACRNQSLIREWTLSVLGLVRGEVDEAHAVVELERCVVKPGGVLLVQLGVDGADELFVLRRSLGLDLVANNDVLHV